MKYVFGVLLASTVTVAAIAMLLLGIDLLDGKLEFRAPAMITMFELVSIAKCRTGGVLRTSIRSIRTFGKIILGKSKAETSSSMLAHRISLRAGMPNGMPTLGLEGILRVIG